MKVRYTNLPLVPLPGASNIGRGSPQVVPDRPIDPRVGFSPAYRQNGWRMARELQARQRRIHNRGATR